MNFNIYVDEATVKKLDRLAKQSGESRNAIVRRALQAWLDREARRGWPESVIAFEGDSGFPRFEDAREGLTEPAQDPLASAA